MKTDYYTIHLNLSRKVGAQKQKELEAFVRPLLQQLVERFDSVELTKDGEDGQVYVANFVTLRY
jgi:hypothetical protein